MTTSKEKEEFSKDMIEHGYNRKQDSSKALKKTRILNQNQKYIQQK